MCRAAWSALRLGCWANRDDHLDGAMVGNFGQVNYSAAKGAWSA
jgi:hypothetical protein